MFGKLFECLKLLAYSNSQVCYFTKQVANSSNLHLTQFLLLLMFCNNSNNFSVNNKSIV